MHACPHVQAPALDWQRISAWSVVIAVHIAAVALLAVPPSAAPLRQAAATVEVLLRETVSPPPPLPPEPLAAAKPRVAAPPTPPPVPRPREAPATNVPPASADPVAAPSEPVALPGPVDIGAGNGSPSRELAWVTPPRLRYPPAAIRARQQGEVLLNVLVDASGRAQRVELLRGSGHMLLDAAARDAVLRARFQPVLRDGVPSAAWGIVPIHFRLDEA